MNCIHVQPVEKRAMGWCTLSGTSLSLSLSPVHLETPLVTQRSSFFQASGERRCPHFGGRNFSCSQVKIEAVNYEVPLCA